MTSVTVCEFTVVIWSNNVGDILCWQNSIPWSGPIHLDKVSGWWRKTWQACQCCMLSGNASANSNTSVSTAEISSVYTSICTLFCYFFMIINMTMSSYSSHVMMCDCWIESPGERPTFSQLVSTISKRLESLAGYLDFCPIWSSGEQMVSAGYDHLVTVQPKRKTNAYDHLNPTVIISDEDPPSGWSGPTIIAKD